MMLKVGIVSSLDVFSVCFRQCLGTTSSKRCRWCKNFVRSMVLTTRRSHYWRRLPTLFGDCFLHCATVANINSWSIKICIAPVCKFLPSICDPKILMRLALGRILELLKTSSAKIRLFFAKNRIHSIYVKRHNFRVSCFPRWCRRVVRWGGKFLK